MINDRKIRVLHFELNSNLGGIESFLLNLYTQIDRSKIQFEFVTTSDNPALSDRLEELGGVIHKVSSYKNIIRYCQDIEGLLDSKFDIVHIHKNSAINILPLILAKKHNVPAVIIHSHNTAPSVTKMLKVLHFFNRGYICKVADERFACSKDAGKWMFGNKEFKIIQNGILTKQFLYKNDIRKEKRNEFGILNNVVVIGHVGRFTLQKNHMFLVDIFKEFTKKNSKSMLLLIGTGELMEDIREKVKKEGLSEKVIFTGVRHDIANLMMCMDAFVMPSLYEGLPIVGVEAQATGLPVILSDTISRDTEVTEAVEWYSLKDDKTKIVKKIQEAVSKVTEQTRIERNNQVVQNGFDMDTSAQKILESYMRILRKKLD
ncbi:MAG: glycosyltransferase family 1 protein [Clostridium butyricum]|jgi:glycosyltransferase involved in cell wall biosynthesis|nr:glycosyltransferase family 1 protein [Clostridium butyricum]